MDPKTPIEFKVAREGFFMTHTLGRFTMHLKDFMSHQPITDWYAFHDPKDTKSSKALGMHTIPFYPSVSSTCIKNNDDE
jgi:hypothetical protein